MKVFVYKKTKASECVGTFKHVSKVEEHDGQIYIYTASGDVITYDCKFFKTRAYQN